MSRIFTSYFYQVRFFDNHLLPVSICRSDPLWFQGINFYKLRPTIDCIAVGEATGHWGKEYFEAYKYRVLRQFDPHAIYQELIALASNEAQDIVLIGYEVPSDKYSERFAVSAWLNEAGYCVEELSYPIQRNHN